MMSWHVFLFLPFLLKSFDILCTRQARNLCWIGEMTWISINDNDNSNSNNMNIYIAFFDLCNTSVQNMLKEPWFRLYIYVLLKEKRHQNRLQISSQTYRKASERKEREEVTNLSASLLQICNVKSLLTSNKYTADRNCNRALLRCIFNRCSVPRTHAKRTLNIRTSPSGGLLNDRSGISSQASALIGLILNPDNGWTLTFRDFFSVHIQCHVAVNNPFKV
jgi:hypothetical protein